MTINTKLERLRKDSCFLADIPDTIIIPALGQCQDEVTKPIETASVDDIAFAHLALQSRASALYSKIESLRRVYDMARKNGALGADNALDAVSDGKEGQ